MNRVILPRRFSPYITRIKPFMENKNWIFGGIQLISTAGIEEALLKVAV
ncbi:hypothetical protein BACI349Y_430033 [Bacillus sp. 349Y]|nr:hypothetical protein BACI349Y_430033 [Bacillus sp. 349Y]